MPSYYFPYLIDVISRRACNNKEKQCWFLLGRPKTDLNRLVDKY